MTCGWWNRWWHRRQRTADVLFLLPSIRLAAEMRASDEDAIERLVDAGFALHASLPGQEHWRCACALLELPLAVGAVDRHATK